MYHNHDWSATAAGQTAENSKSAWQQSAPLHILWFFLHFSAHPVMHNASANQTAKHYKYYFLILKNGEYVCYIC